jgi:hypothetical protein
MMNRNKLTVAVGIAVGATAGVLSTAQAGQLFFPQAVVGTTVTTIFSVINTVGNMPGKAGEDVLHYRYYYKTKPASTGDPKTDEAIQNAKACEETDAYLPTSKWDIQTIDIGGDLPGSVDGVMFNDPSMKNNWSGTSFDLASSVSKPHRGYFFVEHSSTMDAHGEGLYGEALIFEFGSGAAWGYQGFYKDGQEGDPCDFQNAASSSPSHVSIFPLESSAFTTKFMVTPLWDVRDPDNPVASICPNNENQNTSYIRFNAAYGPDGNNNVAMFDRDENPYSGAPARLVKCVGAVSSKYLINDGLEGPLADGGWTGVRNFSVDPSIDPNVDVPVIIEEPSAVLYKLEYGDISAIDPGKSGVFNNAFYLLPFVQWGIPLRDEPVEDGDNGGAG